jgi:proteasome lid subunit RPN8/RPN11
MMTIWGFRGRRSLLRFRRADWDEMIRELGRRGDGRRESAGFLMARRNGDRRRVVRVLYLDDLDPDCLQGTHIHFDGRAYSRLWDLCDTEGLVVVGDVHTHSGDWVEQSDIDARNPMVAAEGHVALIVPRLAANHIQPADVGVHRYGGLAGWQSWFGGNAAHRLCVRRFL